jgi:hypothetical protein
VHRADCGEGGAGHWTDTYRADYAFRRRYVRPMHNRLIMLGLVMASAAAPAAGQLLGERIIGMQRVCIYAPEAGNFLTGDRGQRQARVGLGENCPATIPPANTTLDVPPTARLREIRNVGVTDRCVYEEGAREWTIPVPASGICPLFAGVAQEQRQTRP